MDISRAQQLAWTNKVNKGFNTTDIPLEFGLLVVEVSEAFTAWRHGKPDVGEELADVALFLMGVAQMMGKDLNREVERKIAKNDARSYVRDAHGVPTRVGEGVTDGR